VAASMRARLEPVLSQVEARCARATYLAGAAFSAADIMTVFSLTTMRSFGPVDLEPYPQIRAYLQQRIGVPCRRAIPRWSRC
jgi:glutathione S-transferase